MIQWSGRGPRICISNKFPDDADVLVWPPHRETTGVAVFSVQAAHVRITWGALKNTDAATHAAPPTPLPGIQNLLLTSRISCGGAPGTTAPQVILKCTVGLESVTPKRT